MTAFNAGGLGAAELEEMATSIEDLVTKGDDPVTKIAVKQLSGFIVKTLIPNRIRSQENDQQMLDSDMKALETCAVEERAKLNANVAHKLDTVDSHKDDHRDATIE